MEKIRNLILYTVLEGVRQRDRGDGDGLIIKMLFSHGYSRGSNFEWY